MSRRYDLDPKGGMAARTAQGVVATLFVVGVASLVFLHHDPVASHGATGPGFLHAPAASTLPGPDATRQASYEVTPPPVY